MGIKALSLVIYKTTTLGESALGYSGEEKKIMRGHGGNIAELAAKLECAPEDILDYSANINPLGPPEYLWHLLAAHMPEIVHYPDPKSTALIQAITDQYLLSSEQVVVGNGTSDLLYATLRTLAPK
ncbi:MAG: hypothetical protein D3923_12955, partial [Candidatus Electrothrix sp. AR3]|nr:hypothetical protein [Candidatus Electrothrix sp. AR3]